MAIVINGSGTIAGITAGGLEEYVVNATVDTMTGDNSDVTLALSVAPGSENNVQITFDGVTQHHSTFSLSGSTITFSTAPGTGVAVEAITGGSSTTGTPDNDTVDGTKIADNACDSEHYTDGSIDLVHLQTGTDGQIISWDASGDPVAVGPGTDGQVLTSTGAGSPPAFEAVAAGGFTLGTEQTTTSGTSFTFSSIPSGTKVIFICFNGVSLSGSDNIAIRIGDAGGIESSGYVACSGILDDDDSILYGNRTSDFLIRLIHSYAIVNSIMTLTLIDSTNHDWVQSHCGASASNEGAIGGGTKSLSAELTQLQILTTGSDTFDAGTINISYQ